MRFYYIYITLFLIFCSFLTGCQKKDTGNAEAVEVQVEELKAYDNLIPNEDLLLGSPVGLKYDTESRHLFIQDLAKSAIIEIDDSSNIVNSFGGRGRGPGEVQGLTDFFITKEHLFILDGPNLINKYSRRDGDYISSLDYGQLLENKIPPTLPYTDINNIPFVTLNESVLLPSQTNGNSLYQVFDWEENKLADLGEIPAGYTVMEDNDKIRSALENKNVPARDSSLAFPVNDRSNPEEIFLVYSAIPKIAKYNLSGEKIWERMIPNTPEVDSLMLDLQNAVNSRPNYLPPVRKYISGRSSPDGDLYLFTYTNLQFPSSYHRPMWIHRFDSGGRLVNRYKIISDVSFSNHMGIDFERDRIFAVRIKDIEIRIYHF